MLRAPSRETEQILGGFQVCRPAPIYYEIGVPIGFTLISDTHLGAPNVDEKRLDFELDRAKDQGDRILLNGDVFDMILVKDAKRFSPTSVHHSLSSRNDLVNAVLEIGVRKFGPYVEQIDMIGLGNHESAVEKWHSIDVTKLLIDRLMQLLPKNSKHVIHYGGFGGFVDYRMHYIKNKDSKNKHGVRWILHYFHGAGGAAPITKGMIDFSRRQWVVCDLAWLGHKHNRFATTIETLYCPLSGWEPQVKERREVMTGAYFDTYRGQSQESIHKHGRRSNYAADRGYAPQGKGGARVEVTVDRGGKIDVEVIQ